MNAFEKYGLLPLEEHVKNMTELGMTENDSIKDYYNIFLMRTDHITNKLVEGSVKTEDITEELKYREIARQEIAKLNGEMPAVAENQKTLEQRVSEAEKKTETAVSYDEMQAAIMEGVNEV